MAANLKSGELARITGLSADTLRHYEKLGVLPKALRTQGGYRLYPPDSIDKVRVIQSALRVGFTLTELADFLKERAAGGAPCHRIAELAGQKLESIDLLIADLTKLRDFLDDTVTAWKKRLKNLPAGRRAGLLDSLASPNMNSKGTNYEADSIGRTHLHPRLPRNPSRARP